MTNSQAGAGASLVRIDDATIRLNDGSSLGVRVMRYPLSWADQSAVIDLWRTEWEETGFDWLPWLNGVHADTLMTETAVGSRDQAAIATATVVYPVRQPETCAVMNVVTRKSHRGQGIAQRLTDLIVTRAFDAGCTSAYLGNIPTPHSAYEKCGFARLSGVFMRRTVAGQADATVSLFAAGQKTAVRPANWGDIPGHAALVAQPLDTLVLDYPRGLVSAKHHPPERGLSQFAAVWYGSRRAGGEMHVLIGDTAHRVLGFGSFTPGPGSARSWLADIDFVCHPHYEQDASGLLRSLIDAANGKPRVQVLRLFTAETDTWKQACARQCGFGESEESTEQMRIAGKMVALRKQKLALNRWP